MRHFETITTGIDVGPLRFQLDSHPELWDEHRNRTAFKGSPFEGTSDLWLRYRDKSDLIEAHDFKAEHKTVNYPSWHAMPATQDIVFDLARIVKAVRIGGVLMTRIPPGGKILPHHDRGSWHAEFYNTKIYIPIKANDQCINYCGDEQIVIREGDAVSFDNLITHSVENNGSTERVTLIVCFRTDP